jgi:hypothetical protein
MRFVHPATAGAVLMLSVFSQPCNAIDWKAFDDPKTVLITERFAKSVVELPTPQKTAAIRRLQESLKSNEVEIRRRAALTLNSLGDKSGVPTMIEDFSKATGDDRNNLVVALRILKDGRAIPALRTALKDKSPYVRCIAVESLGELKATKAYNEIVGLTKDRGDNRGGKNAASLNCLHLRPAASACYALGALGDQRAVPVLIELLTDKELQYPAMKSLQVLTKQKFGNDPEMWKAWWKGQGR